MARITFEKGNYVTFLGLHSGVPIGRVVDITVEGHPVIVFRDRNRNIIKKEVFEKTSKLIPACTPIPADTPTEIHKRLIQMFETISAIYPELDNPSATEDEPVEQSSPSPSDHGVDAGDYDDPSDPLCP